MVRLCKLLSAFILVSPFALILKLAVLFELATYYIMGIGIFVEVAGA